MPEQVVLGLTGMAGSGKSTAARYLKRKYGFDFITLSDIVMAEARKKGLVKEGDMEMQKDIISKFGVSWRKESGNDYVVAEKAIERIRESGLHKVVIDGFRSPGEVRLFRKSFPGFRLVYITVDPDVRWKRRLAQDPDAKKEDFQARDKRDMESMGLAEVLKMADTTIDNSSNIRNLEKELDALMKRFST